jgi:hypothetical protein
MLNCRDLRRSAQVSQVNFDSERAKPASFEGTLRWVRREPNKDAMNQLNLSLQHSKATIAARGRLLKEQSDIVARLAEIGKVLGGPALNADVPGAAAVKKKVFSAETRKEDGGCAEGAVGEDQGGEGEVAGRFFPFNPATAFTVSFNLSFSF